MSPPSHSPPEPDSAPSTIWENAEARRVLDSVNDFFLALDRDYTIVFVNRALAEGSPRGREGFVGRNSWSLWPEMRGSTVEISFERAFRLGVPEHFQYHYEKSGVWIEVDVYPVDDFLHVYFRDVTKQKREAQELAEREARLRAIVDAIPHIAWTATADGAVTYVNARWQEYTGSDRTDLEAVEETIHPDDLSLAQEASEPRPPSGAEISYELRLRGRDGQYRWHRARLAPYSGADGRPSGWIGTSTDIHDERLAREQLERSAEKLRSQAELLELANDAIFVQRLDGQIISWNGGAERTYGWTLDEATGKNVHRLLDTRGAAIPDILAELQRSGEWEGELIHTTKSGAVRVVSSRWALRRDNRGEPVEILEVNRDVTEERAAAIALAEGAERLRLALGVAEAGVWHLDSRTLAGEWDGQCHRLHGLPNGDGEVSLESWLERIEPQDRSRWSAAIERGFRERAEFRVEYRVAHPTLGLRWLVSAGGALNGDPVRLTGITYDFTEARQRVAALEATISVGQALASELETEPIVQALTDASTLAIGAEFGAFFYNTTAETGDQFGLYVLSGAPKEAFVAFPFVRSTPLFEPTFSGREPVLASDVLEDPRFGGLSEGQGMPPGHLPVRSYLGVPVRSRTGEALGALLFGHSEPGRFTEEHLRLVEAFASQASVAYENALLYRRLRESNEDLERRVRERTEELQSANETLAGFNYHISHDLRSPLRAIISSSRMILEDYGADVPEDAKLLLGRQADAALRLARLIDDLLKLSRLSREELRKNAVDLSALAREAAGEALSAHPETTTRVEVADGMTAEADPRLLHLALLNLIENAVKYSPEGGTIRVGRRPDGAFFVSDEGIGMENVYLEKIFEPFQRLHRDDRFTGTGIGLANVRQVVDRHGGRIWAESEPGRGSTFFFRLGGEAIRP